MSKKATLLWVDLEMTGLVPGEDKIMEVAAIATDWKLEKIAEYTGIVKVDESIIANRMVGEFWEKNKDSYNSLVEQNKNGKTAREIEKELLEFIEDNFAKNPIEKDSRYKGKIILAGNSIHQDRKFIDIEWPELSSKLHYRMLDVSAWKVFFEGAKNQKFMKQEAHRALDDIEGSISELKWYNGFLKEIK